MPTPPYARLGIRVAAGAPQYGGLTLAHGDSIQLVAESTAFWSSPAAIWQIYDYPDGWAGPGAPWLSIAVAQPNGLPDAVIYQYVGNSFPPAFVLPADPLWGKFGCSLRVNNGSELSDLYDDSTGFQILSPQGLMEVGFRESSQFGSWRAWAGVIKAIVRRVNTLFAALPSLSNAVPQAVGTAAAGVGTASSRDDHVHAHGNQATSASALHALAIAGGNSGFLSGTDKQKLDDAAVAATVSTLALRGASGESAFGYLYASGSVPTVGFVRGASGFVVIATLTAAGAFDNVGFSDDGADAWKIGNDTRSAGVRLAAKTGGSATVEINNVVEVTLDATGINLASGNTYQVNGVAHTASSTASSLMFRDAAGRASVVDPSADTDIDTKGARNTAIAANTTSTSTTFIANGTVAIPTAAKNVRVAIQAAGGPGGGGAMRAAGVAVGGGGGGSGGNYAEHTFDAAVLRTIGATITVTLGAAGAIGAGAVVDDTDGAAGTDSAATVVSISGTTILAADGGKGGAGGTVAGGAAGAANTTGEEDGSVGGAGGDAAAATAGTAQTKRAGAGGGGGAGITAANVPGTGGNGGAIPVWRGGSGTGAAGGAPDAVGAVGQTCVALPLGGGGGSGGGGDNGTRGGAGGDGGPAGGGGGGGGAGRNGNAGGDGGAGRAACVIVEIW